MNDLDKKLVQAIDKLIPVKLYWPNERYEEPELRHVLWALSKRYEVGCQADQECIMGDSIIEIGRKDRTVEHTGYDLAKPLFSQSTRTKQWLLDLLT